MGRAVFAQADGIVSEDIDNRQFHQSRQPNGRPHIVGENQKGAAVWDQRLAECQTVQNGAHGMFSDAETDIGPVIGFKLSEPFNKSVVRGCQVC